jgi:hypothetical protein
LARDVYGKVKPTSSEVKFWEQVRPKTMGHLPVHIIGIQDSIPKVNYTGGQSQEAKNHEMLIEYVVPGTFCVPN